MNRRIPQLITPEHIKWLAFALLLMLVFLHGCEARGAECAAERPVITASDVYLAKAQAKIAADAQADSGLVIDRMIVYTDACISAAGGEANLKSKLAAATDRENQARANSGVTSRIRDVYVGRVQYVESGNSRTDLENLTGGRVAGVYQLREEYGADLVAMVFRNLGDVCGRAWLCGNALVYMNYAFSVTQLSCLSNNTLAHESGHNQGCAHDPANAHIPGAFPYSYGARSAGGNYGDLMSYGSGRTLFYSGPNSLVKGLYAVGDAAHDNARTLNEMSKMVANWRPTRVPLGAQPTPTPTPVPTATPVPTVTPAPTPVAGEFVKIDETIQQNFLLVPVAWSAPGDSRVDLILYRNGAKVKVLATSVRVSPWIWNPSGLAAGPGYQIGAKRYSNAKIIKSNVFEVVN